MHEIVAGDGLGLGNVDLELVVDALGLGTDEDGVFLRVFGIRVQSTLPVTLIVAEVAAAATEI